MQRPEAIYLPFSKEKEGQTRILREAERLDYLDSHFYTYGDFII
jgi:hypothetical protein